VTTLPLPSFDDRPVPYFLCCILVLLLLCLWPFNFHQTNQVTWEPEGGVRFTPPATAYTSAPPAKLALLREWTILLDVKALAPWRQGRILGYGLDERYNNLSVDQLFDDLILRIRTDGDQRPRAVVVQKLFEQSTDRRFMLAIAYDGNDISAYIDGIRKVRQKIGIIDYSSWDNLYPLILGSFANGKYGWRGIFYQLCVLSRAVMPEELNSPQRLLRDTTTVLRYTFDEREGTTVIDHGRPSPAALLWSGEFSPYIRTVLQSPRDYWPNPRHPFIMDIIANIIIYIPVGFLLSILSVKRLGRIGQVIVVVVIALIMSLTVEIAQAYLPTRSSSSVDILTNGLGAYVGLFVHRKGWVEKILSALNVSFPRQFQKDPLPQTHSTK